MAFDPKPYMINMQGNDYLPVAARIAWFRNDHPSGVILSRPRILGDLLYVEARVLINGQIVATGMAGIREFKRAGMDRGLEKAETAAIGRALGIAGYGTLQAGDELDDRDYLADSPHPVVAFQPPTLTLTQPTTAPLANGTSALAVDKAEVVAIATRAKYVTDGRSKYVMFDTPQRARLYGRDMLRKIGPEWEAFVAQMDEIPNEALDLPRALNVVQKHQPGRQGDNGYWIVTALRMAVTV